MTNTQFDLWTDLVLLNASSRFDFEDETAAKVIAWSDSTLFDKEKMTLEDGINDDFNDTSGSSFVGSLISNMDSFISTASSVVDAISSQKDYSLNLEFNGFNGFNIPQHSKFFVIKSFNERNVSLAVQHQVWSSTRRGNKKLQKEYQSLRPGAKIFLLFSVNKSGKFCGMAEMCSDLIRNDPRSNIWETHTHSYTFPNLFQIKWLYVKDVQVRRFNHLAWDVNLGGNENFPKMVGQCRDTDSVPFVIGCQIVSIFSDAPLKSSLSYQ